MASAIGLASRANFRDWWRHDEGLRMVATRDERFVEFADRYGDAVVRAIQRAVNVTLERCDEPTELLEGPRVWAHAVVPQDATLVNTPRDTRPRDGETPIDVDPGAVVVINVRRIGRTESRRTSDWLADEVNRQADSSKLRGVGVGVARVMAGGPDAEQAMLQAERAANALGLGLVPGMTSRVSRPGLGLLLGTVWLIPLAIAWLILGGPVWACLLMLIPPVGMTARWWMRRDPINDIDQRPRHRWWRAEMRRARSSDVKTQAGGDDADMRKGQRIHDYAFQPSSMPIPPAALAAALTPPSERTGRVSGLTVRPPMLDHADGPLLGYDADGRRVAMWADAMFGGIALFGEPGGGKSNGMHGIIAWAARHHQAGDLMVDFESKGADSIPILNRLSPGMTLVDVNDPSTPMIDILGMGSPARKAERFAALMRAALGDQQIGPQSRIQLRDAVYLALEAGHAKDLPRRCQAAGARMPRGWVECAARLLGRQGVREARALARAIMLARDNPDVSAAVSRLNLNTDPESGRPQMRDGELATYLRAPMNKMDLLASAPWLYTPRRRTLTWADAIHRSTSHADARLVVNLGASVRTDRDGRHHDLDDDARRLIGALLFRSLKDEIVASCDGWQTAGRHARLFVDELTDVMGGDAQNAGGNSDILSWLREKGRAYGVEMTVGTQNTGQLSGNLLNSVTGFMTVGSYVLRADTTALPAAQAVDVDPTVIRGLARHTIAIRTVGPKPDMTSLPPMVVTVPWFDNGQGLDDKDQPANGDKRGKPRPTPTNRKPGPDGRRQSRPDPTGAVGRADADRRDKPRQSPTNPDGRPDKRRASRDVPTVGVGPEDDDWWA